MEGRQRRLIALVVVTSLGFALFFQGFFPVKPLVPGYTPVQTYASSSRQGLTGASTGGEPNEDSSFSRLVFILIDALRSDFVFGDDSNMTFARSLIADGRALPFTAIARPPTVTLPRLKALTTGSNPTFLDAILNIADEGSSSSALENVDSWIRQFRSRKPPAKIAFAGDDTWLRLFPSEWFVWSEGVGSFFVSDTHTVDSNVTRHLDSLLSTESLDTHVEWDVLILHYLGLDHVGHLEGPKSPLMPPKQAEMDDVIRRVFDYLELRDKEDGKKSLLVVGGDHGMTEGGNHGGSTEAETSSALLLASPWLEPNDATSPPTKSSTYHYHEVVEQVDLVPTLSVLFDLGIPKNSLGKVMESAIRRLRPAAMQEGLRANSQQILNVLSLAQGNGDDLACQISNESNRSCEGGSTEILKDSVVASKFIRQAQDQLLISFADYRLPYLASGLLVLATSCALLSRLCWRTLKLESSATRRLVGLAVVIHLGSFFATSFIEEEHEFWFFATVSTCLLLSLRPNLRRPDRLSLLCSALAVRIMRSWSPNGQKDVPNESISAFLSQHSSTTTILITSTYLVAATIPLVGLARASRLLAGKGSSPGQLFRQAIAFAILATITSLQATVGLLQKMLDPSTNDVDSRLAMVVRALELDSPSTLPRIGYILGLAGWTMATLLSRRTVLSTQTSSNVVRLANFALILMSLTRPVNIPLFVLFFILHDTLARLTRFSSPLCFAFVNVAFQSISFFALGGSNSLATVDLSQAYNGLTSYSFLLVTLQTYLSNFSGPIFFSISSSLLIPPESTSSKTLSTYRTTFFALSLTTLVISATHFRYHLFAFTVFSPAVLYKAVWWGFVQVGTNELLARLLTM